MSLTLSSPPRGAGQRAHCAICTDRIWGLGRQGYKCINCKLLVHKKCHKLVTVECGRQVIQVRALSLSLCVCVCVCVCAHDRLAVGGPVGTW